MSESRIDPVAILQALGMSHVSDLTPVSGGWDTFIWRVEAEGQVYALRVFGPGRESACRREVAAMRAAAAGGIPVPYIFAETHWNGHPALLLGWIPGQPVMQRLPGAGGAVFDLGLSLGRTHARIHAVPAPELLRRETGGWIAAAGAGEQALRLRLKAMSLPETSLLHLDYHPLNVMVEGLEVTGVLDWANAAAGPPQADLARTIAILRLMPAPPGAPPELDRARRALLAGWEAGYQQQAGSSGDMALFYAWAGAAMLRDLAPKLGDSRVWLDVRHLDRVRRWTRAWKHRAGLPA